MIRDANCKDEWRLQDVVQKNVELLLSLCLERWKPGDPKRMNFSM